MSTDLSRALHDAVDVPLGAGRPALDTTGLAARIRRRRAVRAGVRGTVGLGAAGAVALGGAALARSDAAGLPAAVPGAAPGACGSEADSLGSTAGDVSIEVVGAGVGVLSATTWQYDSQAPLGSLQGRELAVSFTTLQYAGPGATAELVPSLDEPPHLAVVHEGTVVSVPGPARRTPAQEAVDSQARLDPSGFHPGGFDATSTPREVVVDLAACGTDGEPLPPGRYDVYAWTDAASPGERVVDGPWDLELLEPVTTPVALPAGFPADVPLVHGELVEAVSLDGTTASGWLVTVGVAGTDGRQRALRTLADAGYTVASAELLDGGRTPQSGLTTLVDEQHVVELSETVGTRHDRELTYRIRER
ncbi:hypothetical protein [Cellulomonas cellasea]|uniref:Uncharacterized protein n=1 Tax=Cellulomonas cellasea TaxID=43670 RepID=A0A7W4UDV4_9CELL|nr:hypothetical protein [Cellulomonas cellasea]MBB2922392.1 hypothetical protein [Cellulomonas cellasea]